MKIIKTVIKYLFSLMPKVIPDGKNFFDYSSREKKKIIKIAANNAAKMKRETINKYFSLNS